MEKILKIYKQVEATLANVKFAVVIISLFTIALIYGTFMESYHGTDYANRLVYKAWWFMLIQLGMFLSIFMATVVRLPMKKRLHGFYVIHAGLLILFMGSFFTYINGVDGILQLLPNTPASSVSLSEDILKVDFQNLQKSFQMPLPYKPGKTKLDTTIEKVVKVKSFIPFAERQIKWVSDPKHFDQQHSSQYLLFNETVSQELTLSLSPRSDYKSSERLGPLSVHYMPQFLQKCFANQGESGFLVWNLVTSECFTPESKNYPITKTDKGARFVSFTHGKNLLKFFPDFSPVAVNDDLTKNENSPFRVLSTSLFVGKPHLFLFGESVAFYKSVRKSWVVKKFGNDQIIKLPWMNFKVRLLKHSAHQYPIQIPMPVVPIQDNGNIIKGNIKAVEVEVGGKSYFVRSDGPLELSNSTLNVKLQITSKQIRLPYQITLERFKMNTNPGTSDPASYESFVQLLDGRESTGVEKHHVFMNNPLKYDDFTFYQASYFPVGKDAQGQEQFGSALSVNYDPGRFFKYLGSLLIVLGSIWHFIINRKKTKKVPA
ncbi:MAG: hypothetical protein CME65_05090 [Halobacteriovoraceae bacterium]|nr:hypothetical protein [Halobacteriovoraceae bacterium]|tara:strand:+ start:11851 stop:13482 length:1632 start_codon:yes stop_codon:yes gene_type:complete